MMKGCPNPNTDEWKALVDPETGVGETEARRDFAETGEIRPVEVVKEKLAIIKLNPGLAGINAVYSAKFVPSHEEDRLRTLYPPVHPNTYYHHSTIEFKPKDISNLDFGNYTPTKIIGRITTDKIDALLIENPKSKNKYPHITLSTAAGVKPFESNAAFENNPDKIEYFKKPVIIRTVEGVFTGQKDITSLTRPKKNVLPGKESFERARLVLPIGISGSGKSTWIKSLPSDQYTIISPDEIRVEVTGSISDQSRNAEVFALVDERIDAAMVANKQVILDATNLNTKLRRQLLARINNRFPGAEVAYKVFEANADESKARIKADLEAGKQRSAVPDSVIDRQVEMYKQTLEDIKSEPIAEFNQDIQDAIAFARDAHKSQKRKYTGVPYHTHLEAVARKISEYTNDRDVIIAAILHDSIEDVGVTYDEIKDMFGKRVADIVHDLTDEYTKLKYPDLNRAERKAKEAERLSKVSAEAKLIKAADKLHNIQDIAENDPKFAVKYLEEALHDAGAIKQETDLYNKLINKIREIQDWLKTITLDEPISELMPAKQSDVVDYEMTGAYGDNGYMLEISHNGKVVGNFVYKLEGKVADVVAVELLEGYRNKGIGKKLYKRLGANLLKDGIRLRSGELNEYSENLWKSMVLTGDAIKRDDGYEYINSPSTVAYNRNFPSTKQRDLYIWLRTHYGANFYGVITRPLQKWERDSINAKIYSMAVGEEWKLIESKGKNWYVAKGTVPVLNGEYTSDKLGMYRELTTDQIAELSLDPYLQTLLPGRGINHDIEVDSTARGKEALQKIAEQLSIQFPGIKYQFIDAETAARVTEFTKVPWSGEPAFFHGDTTYFVGEALTEGIIFHEFAHPFVRSLQLSNAVLFQKLYASVAATAEGQSLIKLVGLLYPEHDPSSPMFTEEVMVRSLQKLYEMRLTEGRSNTTDKSNAIKEKIVELEDLSETLRERADKLAKEGNAKSVELYDQEEIVLEKIKGLYKELENSRLDSGNAFVKAIKNFLYHLKQLIRKAFDKVRGKKTTIEGLNVNTTLEDLIKMLEAGAVFKIDTQNINKEDIAAYAREQAKEEDVIKEKIKKSDVAKISKKFYDVIMEQLRVLRESGRYSDIADVFAEDIGISDIRKMKQNLTPYKEDLLEMADKLEKNIEYSKNNAEALVNSLFRLDRLADKMSARLATMVKEEPDPSAIQKVYYYFRVLDYWKTFINKDILKMFNDNSVGAGNPLYDLVSGIERKLAISEDRVSDFYKMGVKDVIMTYLTPLKDHIDEKYQSILKKIEESGNDPKLRAKYQKKYDRIKITPEKIESMLSGKLGDAHALNSFLEGYMYNQDPIIAGFSKYVNDSMIDVMVKAQARLNDFMTDITPELEKMGYNPSNIGKLGKQLSFLDTVFFVKEDGEIGRKQVHTFLNPHRYTDGAPEGIIVKALLLKDLEKLENLTNTDENRKLVSQKKLEIRRHERKYWNQEYIPEYYEAEKLFEPTTLTADEIKQGFSTTAGAEAWDDLQAANNALNQWREKMSEEVADDIAEEKAKQLAAARNALYDLNYANNTPKTGIDLQKALILREYRAAGAKFNTREVFTKLFQEALWKFEDKLKARVDADEITSEEYNVLRQEWINRNTEVKLKPEYTEKRDKIQKEWLSLIKKKYSSPAVSKLYEKRWDIIKTAWEGSNRQPNGNSLTPEQIKELKEIELAIIAGKKGSRPKTLSQGDEQRYKELQKEKQELLYGAPTDSYLHVVNTWLEELDLTQFKMLFPTNAVSERTADAFISSSTKYETLRSKLFKQSPAFKKWFLANHVKVTKGKKGNRREEWERLAVWNVNKPQDEEYYESTQLYEMGENGEPAIVGDPILRVPNYRFSMVVARKEYVNAEGKTVQIRTPKIVGETIDNKGRWLPKTKEQGAPSDSPYINEEYYNLKVQSPAVFNVLEKMKKYHLENQVGLGKRAKLYMQLPRYRQEGLEIMQGKSISIKDNPISNFVKNVRDWFKSAKDDFESGYDYQDDVQEVFTDLFDDEVSSVPISGKYDIDHTMVSLDITTSLNRYMLSGERYKKLLELQPMAKALQTVVSDPRNAVRDMTKLKKQTVYNSGEEPDYALKKGTYVRKKFIDSFIDREFYGQTQAGYTKDMKWLQKIETFLYKRASMGFFALNLPSALKNSLSAHWQMMLESIGGVHITPASYAKGVVWSGKAMVEVSSQLYSKTPKSLNVQMIQIFDAIKGQFEQKFGEQMSRTVVKDVAEFSWLYNVRKWTEMEATLSLFGAMMKKQKVTQTINGESKQIDYIDAWKLDDKNKIVLKEGIDPEWGQHKVEHIVVKSDTLEDIARKNFITVEELKARNKKIFGKDSTSAKYNTRPQISEVLILATGEKFKAVKNTVDSIQAGVQGAYDAFNQPDAQRYLWFRMISFLRKFFIPLIMKRFAFKGNISDPDERYDIRSGRSSMGYYITTIDALKRITFSLGKELPLMGVEEKKAAVRTIGEIVLMIALIQLYQSLFDWDPDDEDRFEKLRKKSGAMPFFGLVPEDPDRPFELDGWLSNHMLNLMMQIRSENDQWIVWPGMGLENYQTAIDVQSYAYGPTIEAYFKLINDLWLAGTDDDRAYYQRDIGAYSWQKEDSFKFWNHLLKAFGLTGSFLDPATAIKSFVSMQQPGRK